ncbi:MAG: Xaa-Pro peptidase family protein [Pseudomonadota bacterium]
MSSSQSTKTGRPAPSHGFDTAEFASRTDRAQALMSDHALDALLVTTPQNVRYVSGFDSQFWESPTRPWFVLVPRTGRPVAIIPEIGAPAMACTWVEDIRTWPAPVPDDDGVSLLAAAIDDLPKRFGRVGMELGREMSLRMPVTDFLALRDRVGTELADGSPCLWDIRMVKTPAEITRIADICAIASDAYGALPDWARSGMTDRQVSARLRQDILARGADNVPFLPAISGPGGVDQIVCGPGDRELTPGDILFIDTGSTFDGYFCDFDRQYAVGPPSDAVARAHETLWQATEAGLQAARPGALTDDLYHAMARILEEAGAPGGNVGRLGHGLGLQLTEPPSHRPGDGTTLAEGMVLTIEPGMEYAPGKMLVHEENIVLTADGAQLLTTRAPRELPILS